VLAPFDFGGCVANSNLMHKLTTNRGSPLDDMDVADPRLNLPGHDSAVRHGSRLNKIWFHGEKNQYQYPAAGGQ